MYSLLCGSKILAVVEGYEAACEKARELSKVDNGTERKLGGVWYKGRTVTVWSGPINGSFGVTRHCRYTCGHVG